MSCSSHHLILSYKHYQIWIWGLGFIVMNKIYSAFPYTSKKGSVIFFFQFYFSLEDILWIHVTVPASKRLLSPTIVIKRLLCTSWLLRSQHSLRVVRIIQYHVGVNTSYPHVMWCRCLLFHSLAKSWLASGHCVQK